MPAAATDPLNPLSTPAARTSPPAGGRRRHAYAFSFNRESFRGTYGSRPEAVAAAEAALATYPAPVEAIWVARVVRPRPSVEALGEVVIHELAERNREEGRPSLRASVEAISDLDDRLAAVVRAWLDDHALVAPAGVEAVSEHTIRTIPHVGDDGSTGHEVSLIGEI